jgi:hypothetical protein
MYHLVPTPESLEIMVYLNQAYKAKIPPPYNIKLYRVIRIWSNMTIFKSALDSNLIK